MIQNNGKTNKFTELSHLIEDAEHVWIFIHDGPDPDCMAASMGLQQLLKTALGCQSIIVGGGYVQRPDNRAMMEMLNIEIIPPKKAIIPPGAPVITVDTQPEFTNNSLPSGARVVGVIDHHLSDSECRAPFLDLRPEFGAAASIVAQYFRESEIDMHRRTATALAFGIASETRDMERVKRQIEVELYTWVLSLADHPILGRLRNPKIERDYVCTLSHALNTAYLYSSECLVCHMPQLPHDRCALNDPRRLFDMASVFARYPGCTFEILNAAELSSLDIVQMARIYPNVLPGGLWWFAFRGSVYRNNFQYRLEALPACKSTIIATDARCIEWAYIKTRFVKHILGQFLWDQIEQGLADHETAIYAARCWLHDTTADYYMRIT